MTKLVSNSEVFSKIPAWQNTGGCAMVLLMEFTESMTKQLGLKGRALALSYELACVYPSHEGFWDGEEELSWVNVAGLAQSPFKKYTVFLGERFPEHDIKLELENGLTIIATQGEIKVESELFTYKESRDAVFDQRHAVNF